MYAGRKRKKPVPRAAKPGPAEGATSNPSKRHRERLNSELERLAGLLPFPEEVLASLDKLSVLRLGVSYLRAKSFFSVALQNHSAKEAERNGEHDRGPAPGLAAAGVPEGELLLQALNGFVLVVTSEGLIFYSSHTIQDYLGFHQTDVMHQSVFQLIHTEDQQEFRRNLHWALNPPHTPEGEPSSEGEKNLGSSAVIYKPDQLPPENSAFLERSFVCRFRCLLDNSSGFLALNLQGRLKFLHGQNKRSKDGSPLPPQLALFAISTPLQPQSILEIRTKNTIFRTKHKLDFTPLACDAKGKIILGYTEAELRMCGTGYQFIHAADMLYCAENHVRMMKTGESGLTVFRLLTKDNRWKWVQANARLVYKNGKPEYIIATQRPLIDEEGGEHLRKRSMHLPFTFATGEALLYQTSRPLPGFSDPFLSKEKNNKSMKTSHSNGEHSQKDNIDPNSLLGAIMQQDEAVYISHPAPTHNHSFSSSFLNHLGDVPLWGAQREPWSMITASVSSGENDLSQEEDPLLATLDSLSISSDESCSHSELSSALESLGLNAKDLEPLLLDEKMVMVDMDPDHSLSLSNFLTNDEILSYIHESLMNKYEGGQQVWPSLDTTQSLNEDFPMYQAHVEDKDSQYLSQQMQQSGVAQGQAAAPLWEWPLHSTLGQLSPLLLKPSEEEKQLSDGLQWRPAGEEGLLHFFQLTQGTQWAKAPGLGLQGSSMGVPYPWETHGAQQLEGEFPAMHFIQEDALQPFSLHSQGPGCLGLPSQLKHKASQYLLMNGLCGHNPTSSPHLRPGSSNSPWQDYVSPLLGSPAQLDFCRNDQDLNLQHQGCSSPVHGPNVSTVHFNLNGLSNMETVDSRGSQEEVVPYAVFSPPSSYQLISKKQPSPVPSVSQHPFQSFAAEHFGSISRPLETPMNSYGMYTSLLSQESRHKPENLLSSARVGFSGDCLVPRGRSTPSSKLHSCTEVLPDHQHASSSDFYL
ncbi:aryl hydrocarbon receptor-like [Dromaius novaehollandiae]|uniref:aryl hydrocarbon receptor-like n=1 Tax=Dromaius novaehollandiae TaxID=8790 RepID=UPI00311E1BCB